MRISDWSSDVCSSDLDARGYGGRVREAVAIAAAEDVLTDRELIAAHLLVGRHLGRIDVDYLDDEIDVRYRDLSKDIRHRRAQHAHRIGHHIGFIGEHITTTVAMALDAGPPVAPPAAAALPLAR